VLLDEFKVRAPNGEDAFYAVAPAQCNLREISFSRLFPIEVSRALSYGLARAVAYTHSKAMFMEVCYDYDTGLVYTNN
jgi:hypothetical protein